MTLIFFKTFVSVEYKRYQQFATEITFPTYLKAQERLKTLHQFTAVIFNQVNLFLKNEIIYVSVTNSKLMNVVRCSH